MFSIRGLLCKALAENKALTQKSYRITERSINVKKSRLSLVMAIITLGIILTACGSKKETYHYQRNPEYTYGSIGSGGITEIYDITGETKQTAYNMLGQSEVIVVTASETSSGGVVAYGGNKYVYSSDKKDKDAVSSALYDELIHSK